MTPGIYYSHPACLQHDPRVHSPGHPDVPERLIALEAALQARDWMGWERRRAPAAREQQLELVHAPEHVAAIRDLCLSGGGAIDADTFVGIASFEAALHACGGAIAMAKDLMTGTAPVGFCGVRPSGHHAGRASSMGFCLFDNVAVAAAWALAEGGAERVFILDWDVHAGNGTEEIFRERSDVLFACIHQQGLFPGTGPLRDAGFGEGEGYTINLPVPPGSGEGLWLALLEDVVLPAAGAFAPDLVLISAGFDAHAADPLADCALQTGSFAKMAGLAREAAAAAGAPLGAVLEGGYNRQVLAESVCATLPALAGEDGAEESHTNPGGQGRRVLSAGEAALLERAREQVARRWPV